VSDNPFYGTAGLNVETYDVRTEGSVVGQLAGDVEMYRSLAAAVGGPVLDLGAGTGRVALPLAQEGHEVVGVELSPHMRALAESKRQAQPPDVAGRITFVEGDMADFDLGRAFGLAVIPFRAFQALLEPERQRACLACVHRHLRPGGLLAFHVFDPLLDSILPGRQPPPSPDRGTVVHPVTGRPVAIRVLVRDNDPYRQVFDETWEFTELGDDGKVVRQEQETLSMRWTYRWEMRHLLELSGFEIDGEYGDFRGSPPAYGQEQVWVARRP
jgi:SAM-dependent methyltransferase